MQCCSVQAVTCKSPLPASHTVHGNMCSSVSKVWLPSAGGSAQPVPGYPSWRAFWLPGPQWSWQDHHVSLLYASPVSCMFNNCLQNVAVASEAGRLQGAVPKAQDM